MISDGRKLSVSTPFGDDGRFATLQDVVTFRMWSTKYNSFLNLQLTAAEKADLVMLVASLWSESG
jgi:hypothetical protein